MKLVGPSVAPAAAGAVRRRRPHPPPGTIGRPHKPREDVRLAGPVVTPPGAISRPPLPGRSTCLPGYAGRTCGACCASRSGRPTKLTRGSAVIRLNVSHDAQGDLVATHVTTLTDPALSSGGSAYEAAKVDLSGKVALVPSDAPAKADATFLDQLKEVQLADTKGTIENFVVRNAQGRESFREARLTTVNNLTLASDKTGAKNLKLDLALAMESSKAASIKVTGQVLDFQHARTMDPGGPRPSPTTRRPSGTSSTR